MEQSETISLIVGLAVIFLLYFWILKTQNTKRKKEILRFLKKYNFTFYEMMAFHCKYVGGHPKRDSESWKGILFGVKEEKIIFFQGILSLHIDEGKLTQEKVLITPSTKLVYLFDISIDAIEDIRYFDATTSTTAAIVGGNHWAIPIRMEHGDASVLIDWSDGRFNHSTEFRFTGSQANKRANTLRNTFIKITK